ncbi:hypothetical protein ACHAXS_001245 [Conticribra weissflogii]
MEKALSSNHVSINLTHHRINLIPTNGTNFPRGIAAVAFAVLSLLMLREYRDLNEVDLNYADIPTVDFQPSIYQLRRSLGADGIAQIPNSNQNQGQNLPNQAGGNEKGKKLLDEETKARYRLNFLGGLSPSVGEDGLPQNLKALWSERDESDIAFFWHIPKASGSTMKNIMNFCFDLKRAENVRGEPSMTFPVKNILNMDTHTPKGLQHSQEMNLIDSGQIDVLVSNYFLAGSALFTPEHQGRAFTIMRHPIELAESLFHYRKTASWETSYRKKWKHWAFADYAKSDYYMANWMVRQLSNSMPYEDLDETHLEKAKQVLRKKVLVGISSQWEETIRQFKYYFGWEDKTPFCSLNYIGAKTNANDHPRLERGSEEWNIVAEKEKWDMALYYYALELFSAQSERLRPQRDVNGNIVQNKPVQSSPPAAVSGYMKMDHNNFPPMIVNGTPVQYSFPKAESQTAKPSPLQTVMVPNGPDGDPHPPANQSPEPIQPAAESTAYTTNLVPKQESRSNPVKNNPQPVTGLVGGSAGTGGTAKLATAALEVPSVVGQ